MFGLTLGATRNDPWPLKFKRHGFGARCYNTQRCSIIYNRFQFASDADLFGPSGPPEQPDWKSDWSAGYGVGEAFPDPVQVDWVSLDGSEHRAEVDLAELFEDRLVRHNVPREDIPEGWLAANVFDPESVDILMEVNDRTINVYSKSLVATKEPQIPGNPHSKGRYDLIQVWTHTY